MDLRELVIRAQKGDPEAFGLLVESRKESIHRMAYSYVKNREDALDIVGEAVYRAFISLKKLRSPDLFGTWFTRILINCAIDHINKNKRFVPHPEVGSRAGGEGVSGRSPWTFTAPLTAWM